MEMWSHTLIIYGTIQFIGPYYGGFHFTRMYAHAKTTCMWNLNCYYINHITDHQSEHYRLFMEYYSELVKILSASELSHYFVSDKIISLADHEDIIRSSKWQQAAELLLDRVSVQLERGNITVLKKMLLIIDHHDVAAAKALSLELQSKLSSLKCEGILFSSIEQGNKAIL